MITTTIVFLIPQAMAATQSQSTTMEGDMQSFCSSHQKDYNDIIDYGKTRKQDRKNKQFDLPTPPKFDYLAPCLDNDKSITQKYNKEKQNFVRDYFKKDDEMLAKAFALGRDMTFLGGDNVLDHINTGKTPSSDNTSYSQWAKENCPWMGDTGSLANAIESILQYKYERANAMYEQYHNDPGAESALIDIMLQTEKEATLLGLVPSGNSPMADRCRQLIEQQINNYETQLYQEQNYNLLDNTQYYRDLLAQDALMGGDIDIDGKMKKLENMKNSGHSEGSHNCNPDNKNKDSNKNQNKGENQNKGNKKIYLIKLIIHNTRNFA